MDTITWITPNSFIETDIHIIPEISKHFKIEWHIIASNKETNSFESSIQNIEMSCANVKINLMVLYEELYSISTFIKIFQYLDKILNKSNLLYVSLCYFPFFMPLVRLKCDVKKTVVVVHNVITPKGASRYVLTKLYTNYVLARFKNFQTFSVSQYNALIQKKPNRNVFCSSFALKDYGFPSNSLNRKITFLSFGKIREYKRIDVLIIAAQNAYKITKIPFIVKIAGSCKEWNKYQSLITNTFLFELVIREIGNEEIPNLFGSSHYFVTPYQDIAQSGSLIVGINYNKPIIASDLESFREYVINGETGFLIKPADVNELTNIFCYILLNHDSIYKPLCRNVEQMKKERFSTENIAKEYIDFFDSINKV